MSDDLLPWARDHCPILGSLREEHDDTLEGYTAAVATHLEAKSAF